MFCRCLPDHSFFYRLWCKWKRPSWAHSWYCWQNPVLTIKEILSDIVANISPTSDININLKRNLIRNRYTESQLHSYKMCWRVTIMGKSVQIVVFHFIGTKSKHMESFIISTLGQSNDHHIPLKKMLQKLWTQQHHLKIKQW